MRRGISSLRLSVGEPRHQFSQLNGQKWVSGFVGVSPTLRRKTHITSAMASKLTPPHPAPGS